MDRWIWICLILPAIAATPALADEPGGLLQADEEIRQAMKDMEKRLQERMDDLEDEIYEADSRHEPERARVLNVFNPRLTVFGNFVGRLDDINHIGMDLVGDIAAIYENYGYETEIIVASVRNPLHVVDAALIGADIATIPFKVIEQLLKHPLTDIGIERFAADWEKAKK